MRPKCSSYVTYVCGILHSIMDVEEWGALYVWDGFIAISLFSKSSGSVFINDSYGWQMRIHNVWLNLKTAI